MPTRRSRESQEEVARRTVLANMEHIRSIGEALVRAADTYSTEHKAADASGDWRDDFARNLDEAIKEFHRSLAASAKRVADVYYSSDREEESPVSSRKSGSKSQDKRDADLAT